MYHNILLPTDGSARCRLAIKAGVELAAAVGARVTGLYAAPPATPIVYRDLLPVAYGTSKENQRAIEKAAKGYLAVIEKAARAAGVPCELITVTSDFPAEAILAIAKKKKCDAIIMASHTRRGLPELILGSQTQKVLAGTRVPVLVHR
jgi:nucleotide-binding universal stress UspA family protein